jgi:hypothetical protein
MWYKRSAAEVMEPQKYCIYKNANLIDLLAIISSNDKIDKESYIAVLESPDNPVLIGSFKVKQAFNYLEAEVQEIENKLKTGIANSDYRFQKFFQSLKNETGMEISTAGDSSVIQMSDQLRNFLKRWSSSRQNSTTTKTARSSKRRCSLGRSLLTPNRPSTKAEVKDDSRPSSP